MYEPLEEWNLRTEALIASYMPNLENIKTYHLTSEHLPRICPHPQTSVLSGWTLPFALLAHKYSPLQILRLAYNFM